MNQKTEQRSDEVLNRLLLNEQRLLRKAERGEGGKKEKPPAAPHWYKDRQSRGGLKKG